MPSISMYGAVKLISLFAPWVDGEECDIPSSGLQSFNHFSGRFKANELDAANQSASQVREPDQLPRHSAVRCLDLSSPARGFHS